MDHKQLLHSKTIALILIGAAFTILGIRLFILVNQYSVNLLFWDQWDFLTPLFQGKDLWTLFNWQHAQHRMGIGYLLIRFLAEVTHWNSRADAFAILVLILIATLCTLVLKKRIFGSISIWDVLIVLICLTTAQYETLIGTNNESYTAFPLLLLILFCLAWTIERKLIRLPIIIIIFFTLIFTGQGFIAIPIPFILFGMDLFQSLKDHDRRGSLLAGIGLLGSIGPVLLYFKDYVFNPAVDCFGFVPINLIKYPIFMSVTFARFVGLDFTVNKWLSIICGLILVPTLLIVFLIQAKRVVTDRDPGKKVAASIVILVGYSLLYSASAAIGRLCLGIASAQASRYMTLLIPAFVGLYFFITTIQRSKVRHVLLTILLMGVVLGQIPFNSHDQGIIRFYSSDKQNWKECFLKYEDYQFCNQETQYQIYPRDDARIIMRLDYLKQNQLNLFLDE
jgi:hypothetical protein